MQLRNYAIVDALPEHIPFLGKIEGVCARLFPPGVVPDELLDEAHPDYMFIEAQQNGRLAIAVKKGEPVGFALLQILDGLALLAEVDVLPSHGRRGLGKALVLRVMEMAAREGYGHLYLTTFRHVPWNYPFYRRLGFTLIPEESLPPAMAGLLAEETQLGYSDRVAMRRETALLGDTAKREENPRP